jgi:hypothetical protein
MKRHSESSEKAGPYFGSLDPHTGQQYTHTHTHTFLYAA